MARAAWRRSFWSAANISRFGAAFLKLQREPETSAKAPPLVLGVAMNYTADQLAPFVLSLRASGFAGQIVFLAANLDDQTQAFLKSHAVELIAFNPADYAPYHIINSRWFAYLTYLLGRLASGSMPRAIFLTDVRDVLFQGDPFVPASAELDVFLESETPLLGDCAVNSRWLRTCFGEHVLQELASCPISCAGTVIGSGRGALAYAIEMWNTIAALSDEAARAISDQAAHNLVVRRGLVDGLRINPNGGHVLTMHYVPGDHVQIGQGGLVLGPGGAASPILHQYDRHPAVKAFVDARFALRQD